MGVIFLLSSFPSPEITRRFDIRFLFIKLAHIVEYGILGAFIYHALRKTSGIRRRDAVLFSMLVAGGYGVTDEIHQSFTPGRSALLGDVITDAIAGGAGAALGYALSRSIFARFSTKP